MTESESVALPLGDTPTSRVVLFYMGWMVGFEPTYTGITILCLNPLTTPTMSMLFYFLIGDLERARTVDLQRDRLAF